MPEPEIRIDLHARLGRTETSRDVDALRDEIEDRFGALPDAVEDLVALARLRAWSRCIGIARLDAGPEAVALTFRDGAAERLVAAGVPGPLSDQAVWRDGRLVLPRRSEADADRLRLATELVESLADAVDRGPA